MAAFDDCVRAARIEAGKAEERYGEFTSAHEALGVLVEEFDELRAAIHANSAMSVHGEAIQVAAVALRLAALCERWIATDRDSAAEAFGVRSGW